MTGGDVLLEGARPELLQSALDVLKQTGAEITATNDGIRVKRNGSGIAPVDVTTAPFPKFPTDLQAQFMALMTRANGTSRITETISRTASCTCRNWRGLARASRSTVRPRPSRAWIS
jgi:UDP-N-acetylglucosamine 1-carboxyvinyltransferase